MGITCEIVGELCGIVRVLRPIWPALADPLREQVVMIRIGYAHPDSLITYPDLRNLSACEPSVAEVASDLGTAVAVGHG